MCLMSLPNIHFGSLKDGASAIEVFEVEVIVEMQRSRFILVAWQLPEKQNAPPLSIFFTRFVNDGETLGTYFMSLVLLK